MTGAEPGPAGAGGAETHGEIVGLGQVSIGVTDVARAVAFYREVLGLRYLFEASGMAFFDCGGVRLMLAVPESAEHAGSSILYYSVAGIGAAHARLGAAGVRFLTTPHRVADLGHADLWMAFFRDPDGNVAALMEEVEKA